MPIRLFPDSARCAALACALLLALGAHAFAQAPASPAVQPMANIEPLRLALDQVEAGVQREQANDDGLRQARTNLDPVRDDLRDAIAGFERRIADIDMRLKQLGPAPAAGAPPEEATLALERTRLNERRADLDAALKQARLMLLRAEDMAERITQRRRALFTRELFRRSASALDPAFWMQAVRALPGELRSVGVLLRSWGGYAWQNGGAGSIIAAGLTLALITALAVLLARWLQRRDFRPAVLGTRFARSFFALTALMRVALVMPSVVLTIVLVLDGFGIVPPRILEIGYGLVLATFVAAFGRGVGIGLFSPDEADRRLLPIRDETARLIASHLTWAARIFGAVVFVNVVLRAIVAQVSLTVAVSALFAAVTAGLLGLFLVCIARIAPNGDEVSRAQWLRGAGWLLVAGIAVALVTGHIGLAAFLAGRFLVALGAIGALYILLVFTDALFTEVVTAHSPRGRMTANFFGLQPRSIDLIGTLLSAVIRLLLVLVVLLPLLGPWGLFAADYFGVVREAAFGIRIGDVTISLTAILAAFATVLIGVLATRAVQRWLDTRFLPRTALDPGLRHSISTIFGYIGVIAALALAMAELGLDFQKIALVAGALSIGIGFGLQSVVSNFVSGLILLAERPIRVGDIISVRGEEGTVRRIHVRATEIETVDRSSVIVPNSELITGIVKNRTHTDTMARIVVSVGVAYDSDVEKVRSILLELAQAHPKVMQNPAPLVLLTGLGESAINFELIAVVRNLPEGGIVKSDLYFSILARFRAEGIVIPYPQREVTVREAAPQPERAARKAKRA